MNQKTQKLSETIFTLANLVMCHVSRDFDKKY